jgi:hypothetical protein
MTLSSLATEDDLDARNISVGAADVDALLASASAAVREAAGCSITETAGTITLDGGAGRFIPLPGWAIRSVDAVLWDEVELTDWRLRNGSLFRTSCWGGDFDPPSLTVTYTQGLAECPADIVDLVCSLVAAGAASAADGYDPKRGVSSERIDDYQRSFTRGDDEVVSPMILPKATRDLLASRFGHGVTVTGEIR